jgi:hypothetical protein
MVQKYRGEHDPSLIRCLLAGLRYDFNGINEWVVDDGRENQFYLPLRSRLNILKGLYNGSRAAFTEDVEILEHDNAIAPNVKYPAARAADAYVLFAKPWFLEI